MALWWNDTDSRKPN